MPRPSLIAALLVACACGSSSGYGSSSSTPLPLCDAGSATATTSVTIQGMAFLPACIKVAAGATVTWSNMDTIAHTATADGSSFDTGSIAASTSASRAMPMTAGVLSYHCSIHPYMHGTVIVE